MKLHLHDIVDHLGVAFRVEGLVDYRLQGQVLRFARLVGGGHTRFLELPSSDMADRLFLLSEIAALDLTTPLPATIYHGGESFLLKQSETAAVTVGGEVPGCASGNCELWRYRAAGGRFLQIEAWPNRIRTLEGASIHRSMLEIRPATT